MSRGGNPLMAGGKVIGAIGVSGGTGSQDDVVSLAGVAGAQISSVANTTNSAGMKIPAEFTFASGATS